MTYATFLTALLDNGKLWTAWEDWLLRDTLIALCPVPVTTSKDDAARGIWLTIAK